MLDSNTILGVNSTLGCDRYRHGILKQSWDGWPCGLPIIYPDVDLSESRSIIRTATIFTPSQKAAGLDRYETNNYMIKPVDIRPLYGNHKVMSVSGFDPGKFERLTEFIHDVGAISFIIDYKEGKRNIAKGIHAMESMVKYSSLFLHHRISTPSLDGVDDSYVCIMTFIDLPYCVPLFNMRKVDGIGLSLVGSTVKHAETTGVLNRAFRTDIILSNFMDNVFVLDGISINDALPIDNEMFREIEKMTNLELKVATESRKAPKSAKKPTTLKEKYGYTGLPAAGKDWQNAIPNSDTVLSLHTESEVMVVLNTPPEVVEVYTPPEVVEVSSSDEPEQYEEYEDDGDVEDFDPIFEIKTETSNWSDSNSS